MKKCHSCKRELEITGKIARKEVCPFCRVDLYCCLNCRFYDKIASKECREPVSEIVKEKQKANYCDYFRFKEVQKEAAASSTERARKDLEDLFRQ